MSRTSSPNLASPNARRSPPGTYAVIQRSRPMPVKWGATPPWALSRAGEQAAAVDNEIGVGEPDIELPGFGGARSGRHLTEGPLAHRDCRAGCFGVWPLTRHAPGRGAAYPSAGQRTGWG